MSVTYPNVPLIAGVPAVLRRAGDLRDAQQTLAAASNRELPGTQRWGIYRADGTIALEADSVVSVEHSAEYRISDYPVEGGSFEDYDKVATPFALRVTVVKGGTVEERQQFLTTAQALLETLDLYDVVTPERVYLNVNVTRIGRSANSDRGAGLATVELVLQEVRAAAAAAYSRQDTDSTAPALTEAPVAATPPVSAAPGTTRRPMAVRKVNQGAVQPKRTVISGATLTTTASGRKLFVYDTPPGSR